MGYFFSLSLNDPFRMAQDKNSILVYADWIKKFEALEDAEAGKLIKHFFRYVNDQNPVAPDRITELLFIDMEVTLKRDLKKWDAERHQRSEAGKKGMASRWNNKGVTKDNIPAESITRDNSVIETITEDNSVTKIITNITDSVSVSVSVSDSVTDKEIQVSNIPKEEIVAASPPFKKLNENQFYDSIAVFSKNFEKETLRGFFNYWSEKNEKGIMRFQLQKTWEVKKRLATWQNKNKIYENSAHQRFAANGSSKLGTSDARIKKAMEW